VKISGKLIQAFAVLALSVVVAGLPAKSHAQQYGPEKKSLGAAAQNTPEYLKHAGIDQNLNQPLPLADHFRDEAGNDVALGSYFGKKPAVLALVYFKCRMLCPQVLRGMAASLKQTGFHPGHEYDIVVASIDPTDTPADAAAAKLEFLGKLGVAPQDPAAASIHFLTGTQASIDHLAAATGFHYIRVPGPDGVMNQFAHSSVIMIATPDGRMSKYLNGIDYQPRDVRLALIEASNEHIGTATDAVLLYCCNYTPSQGRYTVSVLRIMGLAAMGSVVALGAVIFLLGKKPATQTS
jgi:protein SCO1/2